MSHKLCQSIAVHVHFHDKCRDVPGQYHVYLHTNP